MTQVVHLIEHILAMKDDSYLVGHPEWPEIVSDAIKARDAMFDAAMDADAPLDVDRQQLPPVKRYVGIGVFEWTRLIFKDVVFVSTMENPIEAIYAQFYGQPVTSCWIETRLDTIELAVDFCEKARIDLPSEQLCHILEIGPDGWGLFQYVSNPPDQEYWKLVDSYCAIEAAERRMSDVAHANDVRFGAPSDWGDF